MHLTIESIDAHHVLFAVNVCLRVREKETPGANSIFYETSPGASAEASRELVRRLLEEIPCHPVTFVTALMYLRRAEKYSAGSFLFHPRTFRRSFAAALSLAYKANEDFRLDPRYICDITDVSVAELSSLEWELATLLRCNFSLSEKEYEVTIAQIADKYSRYQRVRSEKDLAILLALEQEPGQQLPPPVPMSLFLQECAK
jgi:hypothetical protein